MKLVDLIRSSTTEVIKTAAHVKINQNKIDEIINLIETEKVASFFEFEGHIDKSQSQEAIVDFMFL